VLGIAAIPAQASTMTRLSEERSILTYVKQNTTAARVDTAVATTTIIPGKHRIIGYEISPYNDSCVDGTVELYDSATTAAMSSSTIFYAAEAPTGTNTISSIGRDFAYPKDISNGLAIRQGGYTTVTIFYERYRN